MLCPAGTLDVTCTQHQVRKVAQETPTELLDPSCGAQEAGHLMARSVRASVCQSARASAPSPTGCCVGTSSAVLQAARPTADDL